MEDLSKYTARLKYVDGISLKDKECINVEKIMFEKKIIEDQIIDHSGNVLKEGTPINAELLQRYEDTIAKLVERVDNLICR
ncbi:hypothetical protein [Petroclostridium sp. X23]|uniref:hypothetical protein n=1 Tax=Petroclostridium sp. X23 TaxID=3045146 RepID=UPI0024AE452C|nr:hypothetical protein [Petroclostridium sp. X23]WHH58278.1 hypothetical protein QKW49_21140 [Petroclostridium sp. X23]